MKRDVVNKTISKFFPDADKLGSVIDTFKAFMDFFETYEKVLNKESVTTEEMNKLLVVPLFRMGFFSFWVHHGGSLRPILLQALNQTEKSAYEYFFTEAIPTALTVAMPHREVEFAKLREAVSKSLKG